MDLGEIQQKFAKVSSWKRGTQRAPHKPLLLLFVLGWYKQRRERLIRFEEIERPLQELLQHYGPARPPYRAEYPFWRLQNDHLWEVPDKDLIQVNSSGDARKRDLLDHQIAGGLSTEIYLFLQEHPTAIDSLATFILSEHFPETQFDDILQAVGLTKSPLLFPKEATYDRVSRKRRDPRFRSQVLDAYHHRCAMCGFDLKLGEKSVGLEAAHIQWDSHQGPSDPKNGLSLCSLHHKLFDAGAWALTEDHHILISPEVSGGRGLDDWLLKFEGRSILLPEDILNEPLPEYTGWHKQEVFKGK